jgi:hypothetical protein
LGRPKSIKSNSLAQSFSDKSSQKKYTARAEKALPKGGGEAVVGGVATTVSTPSGSVTVPPSGSKARALVRAANVVDEADRAQIGSLQEEGLKRDSANKGVINTAKKDAAGAGTSPAPSKSTSAPNSNVRVFQIYFEDWQKELLDKSFYPLNNSRTRSELLEFAVFEQLQKNDATKGLALWGALSWRFGEKTGLTGVDLFKQVLGNKGHDVYYCNPYPQNEALFHNLWMQGETSHPRFLEVVRAFFKAAGLDESDIAGVQPSGSYSCANFLVATPRFWERYIPFVRKVLVTADKRMDPKLRDLLHSPMADEKGHHAGSTYVPFIVERLLGLFLRTEGRDLKAFKYSLPSLERELNVHTKLLREMKDVAHKTKSPWLAACWVNYRNLYLSQTNGAEWCKRYLRNITPTEVKFI